MCLFLGGGMVLACFFCFWSGECLALCLAVVMCFLAGLLGLDMVLFASFGIVLPLFCFVLVWCLLGCYFDSSWDVGFALFLRLVCAMVSACIFDWLTMPARFCIVWDGATHFLLGLGKVLARCSLIWFCMGWVW